MTIGLGQLLTAGLLVAAVAAALACALLAAHHLGGRRWLRAGAALAGLTYGVAALAACGFGYGWAVLPPLAAGLCLSLAGHRRLRNFHPAGRLFLASQVLLLLFALPWGAWFVVTVPVGPLTRGLLLAGYPLLLLMLPVGLVRAFEQHEVLCRASWRRPRHAPPPAARSRYPKVSVHVPAHAEPPAEVIATLDALDRLDYPNFEVLVIDNNTKDPALWRPVETHCSRLGGRFRFFHLDDWPGAKAGALNFALTQTAPDAELVGVVDADYRAEPDWLARLVGFFDDPAVGFVQPPHAYRDWAGSAYRRMCAWEYASFFATVMPSRNERAAAITVGTMCLIRRAALERAGGWAEWCATEDSELAPRIHALGYTSVYVDAVLGRGLIPETFAGYKKQRFRWTVGPVQELKRHWRLFLPRRWAAPSALTPAQKLHHLVHGLDHVKTALGFLLIPVGAAVAASLLAHGETIPVPFALWLAATVALASGVALRWLAFRVAVGCGLRDALGATLASQALAHTVIVASLRGLATRGIPWVRTDKFRALPAGLAALGAVRTELALGLGLLLGAAAGAALAAPGGLLLMLLVGAVLQGLRYLTAPALAVLAEREVRARARATAARAAATPPAGPPAVFAEALAD